MVIIVNCFFLVSIHAPARGATNIQAGKTLEGKFQSTPPRGGRRCYFFNATRQHSGFNPRPRAGGDSTLGMKPTTTFCFNPRPRAGGDTGSAGSATTMTGFNPRPRAGGDGVVCGPLQDTIDVSIHAPARGATSYPSTLLRRRWFQSTPPRGGRLQMGKPCAGYGLVSIHAPARGATKFITFMNSLSEVSIHAPARGAT